MSFGKYRDTSQELTSDEDDVVGASLIDEEASEDDHSVTIAETDNDDDDIPLKKNKNKRLVITDSSSEEEIEERALSPRTRQSITGYRPSDISSNESDIEDSSQSRSSSRENSNTAENNPKSSELNRESSSYNLDVERKSEPDNESINSPIGTCNRKSKEFKQSEASIPTRQLNRSSVNFHSSISNKLSSTLVEVSNKILDTKSETSKSCDESSSNPVIILNEEEALINISSSSEECFPLANSSPISKNKIIQPKMGTVVSSKLHSNNVTENKDAPKGGNNILEMKKIVSREYVETKLKELDEMKNELVICENLKDTVAQKLPDRGMKMSARAKQLKEDIKKLTIYISTLTAEDTLKGDLVAKSNPERNLPTWDEISAAAYEIQPKHTGKVGLANFNAQKVLTMDRLKDIYGSLETCPSEDVLADDPKGLKISLMRHQRHALVWMRWRENQKPRGGILADDMGLGKTLTMISLILDSKYREEELESDSDNNSEWYTKGKRSSYNGGTLVVCPASLVKQWEAEIHKHTKRHALVVYVHHGDKRETRAKYLAKSDVVITTYNIAAREHTANDAIFNINWERIILDEAHVVRNHKAKSSLAVCNLEGKYRWVLTGTPIQNKEMDLYALLKFLRCSPFDELSYWKRWIESKNAGGQQRLNTLMKSLMLRRTKAQLQENGTLQCLPLRSVELIEVHLDTDEMNVYQKLLIFSRTLFATYLHQKIEKNDGFEITDRETLLRRKKETEAFYQMYQQFVRIHGRNEIKSHEILVLLLRLRQTCDHPGLIDAMLEDEENLEATGGASDGFYSQINLLEQLEKLEINEEGKEKPILSVNDSAMSKVSAKILLRSNYVFDLKRQSCKIRKVLEVLQDGVLRNTADKAIIISQWTSVLDLLKPHLADKGVRFSSLTGSVPVHKRQDIVTDFNSPNSRTRVLLLSLTAGGVGLNLVGANHLLLMDLHWNPQLECQAQDRIYRVGQNKPVYIYKFMCKDTVEERIKALQEQKIRIADGVLTGVKATEGSKLTIEDLKSLFAL